ncbi:MAG: ParA family protein [Planctomycetota bacterium]
MDESAPTRRRVNAAGKPIRAIAVMNQKGGVGKTTTTANLGAALAERGRHVCLFDLDPQAHLTINFGIDPDGVDGGEPITPSLYDLLLGEATFLEAVRVLDKFPQSPGNVGVLPGSIDLAGVEAELAERPRKQMLLRDAVDDSAHDFEYLLIDCPPALGLLTLNALALADELIIPMQPHFLAMQGMAKLIETVQAVNEQINPDLRVGGVVLTMFDANTKLSGEVVGELQNFFASAPEGHPCHGGVVFETRVRRNIKLAESPSFGEPITVYDTMSNGATDYRALAAEILARHADEMLTPEETAALQPDEPEPAAMVNTEIDQAKLRAASFSDTPIGTG